MGGSNNFLLKHPAGSGFRYSFISFAAMAECKKQVEDLVAAFGNKDAAQAALESIAALAKKGADAEPFLVEALGKVLAAVSDKSKSVAGAAVSAAQAIVENMSPFAI